MKCIYCNIVYLDQRKVVSLLYMFLYFLCNKYICLRFEVLGVVTMKMPSSGMLDCVALVRIDVWEECIAPIIRVTRISELGMLAVTCNQSTLWRNVIY
jgi:hypothetical protein